MWPVDLFSPPAIGGFPRGWLTWAHEEFSKLLRQSKCLQPRHLKDKIGIRFLINMLTANWDNGTGSCSATLLCKWAQLYTHITKKKVPEKKKQFNFKDVYCKYSTHKLWQCTTSQLMEKIPSHSTETTFTNCRCLWTQCHKITHPWLSHLIGLQRFNHWGVIDPSERWRGQTLLPLCHSSSFSFSSL